MICPYCNSEVELTTSRKLYSKDYGFVWLCTQYPKCDAYIGCHKGTRKPLGTPANNELRKWRILAHNSFDVLWRRKQKKLLKELPRYRSKYEINYDRCDRTRYIARSSGYKWLSKILNIEFEKCHIGMFDVEQCKRVINACKPYLHVEHINQIEREMRKIA